MDALRGVIGFVAVDEIKRCRPFQTIFAGQWWQMMTLASRGLGSTKVGTDVTGALRCSRYARAGR